VSLPARCPQRATFYYYYFITTTLNSYWRIRCLVKGLTVSMQIELAREEAGQRESLQIGI
jgi:hypothetical protein